MKNLEEVLRAADGFDIIHYHLSSAWLPLAAMTSTPGLFTFHTSPHLDDEFVLRRWPQIPACGISHCQMRAIGEKLGRTFPGVYNGCDFDAYTPSFEAGEYLAFLGRMSPGKNPLGAIRIAQVQYLDTAQIQQVAHVHRVAMTQAQDGNAYLGHA